MERPFPAYKGDESFVFVCYGHEDQAIVYPEIAALRKEGVRLWYDEGISAGRNWRAEIGEALIRADKILFYISATSLASEHCNREINLALDEGKEIIPVYIEQVDLTPDLRVGLTRVQALFRRDVDYFQRLIAVLTKASPIRPVQPQSSWRSDTRKAMSLVAILAVSLGLIAWYLPFSSEEPVEEVSAQVSTPALPSVLISNFEDLSSNEKLSRFARVVEADVGNQLATSRTIDLLAQPISRVYVDYEVRGIVRQLEGAKRVSVKLIDMQTEREVWSEQFDQIDDSHFENGGYVGRMIEVVMQWTEGGKNLPPTANRESFELMKAGMIEFNSAAMGGRGSDTVAVRYLEEALLVNPENWFALGHLAVQYANRLGFKIHFADAQQRAHEHICRALALAPDAPTFALAIVNFRGFLDYGTAIENFRSTIGKGVSSGQVYTEIGWALAAQGKLEEAIDSLNVGISMGSQLNDPSAYRSRAEMEILLGRYQDAVRSSEQAVAAEGGNSMASALVLAEALYRSGEQTGGLTLLNDLWRRHGSRRPELFPGLFALMGETEQARDVLNELYDEYEAGRLFLYGPAFLAHHYLGEIDVAFERLEKAVDNGEFVVFRRLRRATDLASLREDPRFEAIMARIEELESHGTLPCSKLESS